MKCTCGSSCSCANAPTLVILAAGMGSRYGGLKQVDPVGPSGETIMDYSIYDALRAGFNRVVFVIRKDFEAIFREQIASKYEGKIAIEFAFQDFNDLPPGCEAPAERTKPWGTAHAVRAARHVVNTPFAAINADDFYGADAFKRLATFLSTQKPGAKPMRFAMVGYRLDQTLSENGSVARGVCTLDSDSMLTGITEMTKIERKDGAIANHESEPPTPLTGAELVSLNLWGFSPDIFSTMETRFSTWLKDNAANPKAEWYIPFYVNDLVAEGLATVEVLPTESCWFGVTYKEDKPVVVEAIRAMVAQGVYPEKLWK